MLQIVFQKQPPGFQIGVVLGPRDILNSAQEFLEPCYDEIY